MVLIAGHAVNDVYQGAVPALVPFFVAERHYDYVAISGLTLAATVLSSIAQPAFGALTDRRSLPWLVPAGMALAGLGIAAAGLVDNYGFTWVVVALSGLGVAAYHPESARLARAATAGSHVGMSWFSLGGNVGFAAGPMLVTAVLGVTGLFGTPLLAVPAVIGCLVTAALLRRVLAPATDTARAASGRSDNWRAFGLLSVAVVCRSVLMFGLSTFLALFVQHRLHAGTVVGEAALVVLSAFGAVGTLLGGRLADRYGRVRTVRLAHLVTVVALAGLVLMPGPAVFVVVAAVGLVGSVPFSLHVTLGQDYLATRVGTASGVTLGLAVSVGGLVAPLLGLLAEATSLPVTLSALLVAPVVASLAVRRLPEPEGAVRPVVAPSPTLGFTGTRSGRAPL